MRNTGMQPGGGRRRRRRKKCMPPMRTRDRRARLYYVATIFDNQVFPSFLILLSRLLYSCNTVQFKLGKRAINLVTIYLFKTPFDIYPIETLPLPLASPLCIMNSDPARKSPTFSITGLQSCNRSPYSRNHRTYIIILNNYFNFGNNFGIKNWEMVSWEWISTHKRSIQVYTIIMLPLSRSNTLPWLGVYFRWPLSAEDYAKLRAITTTHGRIRIRTRRNPVGR